MPTDDDDDLLPKKRTASTGKGKALKPASARGPTPQMLRLMRFTRTVGILLGGFVTLVGMMSVVGFATDNFWARLIVAVVIVVGLPAFVSDRLLKRTSLGGGAGMVVDIFALVLLGLALLLVEVDVASKPLLVREGDRYARSGSRTMARLTYFLGGVSPIFPEEKTGQASAAGSMSGTVSAPKASGK